MAVSLNRGTPISSPKYFSPYSRDSQKGTSNFGNPPPPPQSYLRPTSRFYPHTKSALVEVACQAELLARRGCTNAVGNFVVRMLGVKFCNTWETKQALLGFSESYI